MKYCFLIIESHHDYCGPNDLPKDVEVGWHDLEDLGCHSCSITRQHNSALKDCPIVDCTDLGVLGAAWSVIEAGCEAGATGGGTTTPIVVSAVTTREAPTSGREPSPSTIPRTCGTCRRSTARTPI